MHAKQYTIKLPADYDMEIVRTRVRERGSMFDDWPGLGLKAFLITEKDRAGGTANRYSPFYLWLDVAGANEFLYGDGFAAVGGSFGRPLIEHWLGFGYLDGAEWAPRSATREDLLVMDGEPLPVVRERELNWLAEQSDGPDGLAGAAVALDPFRWQLVRFALWAAPVEELDAPPSATRYELLHVSAPGRAQLAQPIESTISS